MARTEPGAAPVTYRSPYASFMLTLIAILLALILAFMIAAAVKVRNISHTNSGKIDNLTTQLQQINSSLKNFTKP